MSSSKFLKTDRIAGPLRWLKSLRSRSGQPDETALEHKSEEPPEGAGEARKEMPNDTATSDKRTAPTLREVKLPSGAKIGVVGPTNLFSDVFSEPARPWRKGKRP